jgi:hypothetical protein
LEIWDSGPLFLVRHCHDGEEMARYPVRGSVSGEPNSSTSGVASGFSGALNEGGIMLVQFFLFRRYA